MRSLESGERRGYAVALAGVWSSLGQTLARLEALAAEPEERLDSDDGVAYARTLQYALHSAGELVLGISPPRGSEQTHTELAAALTEAREATAEILDELELGGFEAAQPLVYEWRGALFRVRLARLRLAALSTPAAEPPAEDVLPPPPRALAATVLALGGAVALLIGMYLGLWPLWALGAVAFLAAAPVSLL